MPTIRLIAVLLMLAAPAWANDAAPAAEITAYGEFTARRGPELPNGIDGSTGVTAMTHIEEPRLLRRTDRIAAQLCRGFAIWFRLPYAVPGFPSQVTVRLTHPLLTRPDGESGTEESWPQWVDGKGSMAGFTFTEAWEAVPGTWTFALVSGGKVLAEQAFHVVPPSVGDAPPGFAEGCERPIS